MILYAEKNKVRGRIGFVQRGLPVSKDMDHAGVVSGAEGDTLPSSVFTCRQVVLPL